MTRSIRNTVAVTLVLAAASFAAACDKSGADAQAEADKAQNKANAEVSQASNQVTLTAAQAQAAADTKIASAQADFAATREGYRHKVQGNIDALDKQLADLDVKAKTAKSKNGTPSPDLRATLPALHAQRDAFMADFQSLGNVNAVTWDGMRARLDKEWADLKVAVDKAD